jgi:hypothetical protein
MLVPTTKLAGCQRGETYFSLSELPLARGHGVVVLVAFVAG